MHPRQNIPQHKINPKNYSQDWSPPTSSGLEREWAKTWLCKQTVIIQISSKNYNVYFTSDLPMHCVYNCVL